MWDDSEVACECPISESQVWESVAIPDLTSASADLHVIGFIMAETSFSDLVDGARSMQTKLLS